MHTNWRRKKSDSMSQIGFLFWRYLLAMQLFVCLFACMFVCLFVCLFVCFYVPLENISLIDMDVTIAGEGQQNFTRRLWPLSGEGGGSSLCRNLDFCSLIQRIIPFPTSKGYWGSSLNLSQTEHAKNSHKDQYSRLLRQGRGSKPNGTRKKKTKQQKQTINPHKDHTTVSLYMNMLL